jgi:aryl-alcohol dehydrogenase-like predicted oxidoreductase
MTFGAGTGIWGAIAGLDRPQATRLLSMAIEHGVNMVDTADVYSQGNSERVVGEALADLGVDESSILVASKVRLRTGTGPNDVGLGRSHIMRSVETSLQRIGRSHIDLLQLHDRDALVPLDETLRALDDLVRQGKVRHIGACNFSAADLERANGISTRSHQSRLVSNQVHYTLTSRDAEHEIIPVAHDLNVGLLVWSPLAGGYLSGKYTEGATAEKGRRTSLNFPPIDPAKADPIVQLLRDLARETNATPAQVTLSWILGQTAVASIIIGARTPEQLLANLGAQQIVLTAEQRDRLDHVSKSVLPYPYWMQQFHDKDRLSL